MEKSTVSKLVSAIILILCVISVGVNDVCLFVNKSGLLGDLTIIAFIISTLLFIFYGFSGYKKSSANYYKAAFGSFAVAELIALAGYIIDAFFIEDVIKRTVPTVSSAIMLLIVVALTFGKNFGKALSVLLGYFNLLLSILAAVFYYAEYKLTVESFYLISGIVLSLLVCLMIYAKYKDKDARGTI